MFTIPGLGWEIQSYGLMLGLALLLAWVVTLSLGRRDRLPPGPLGTGFVLGVGLGLVGARIAWVLQRPGEAGVAPDLLVLRADELAPLAGLTVVGLVAGLHVMRRRVPVVAFYDVVAPGFAAGAMVERLGALLTGAGYGDYAPGLAWAIRFPAGSPAYLAQERALGGLLPAGAEQSLPVHPTQIYALVLAGLALAVGLWLRKHRRFSGQVCLGTAITYLLGRALVEEWFRADAAPPMMGPFNAGQVGALVLAASLGVILWSRGKLARQRPAGFRPWEGGPWSPKPERSRERTRAAAEDSRAAAVGTKPAGPSAAPRVKSGAKKKRRKGRR